MDKFLDAILTFFKALFSKYKVEPIDEITIEIDHIPRYGEVSSAVGVIQQALSNKGYDITVDDDFGPNTKDVLSRFQKSVGLSGSGIPGPKTIEALGLTVKEPEKKKGIPWFWALKKYEGKKETDADFVKEVEPTWKKVGLPSFKGLAGSARAWCALILVFGLGKVGYDYSQITAAAKSVDKYCQEINWKVDGIPQGAFVRINHKSDCKSAPNNHTGLANGDCTAQDLLKPNAMISIFGGNQKDSMKVSTFPANDICAVRWPCESELPKKVLKSVNCSNGKTSDNDKTTSVIYLQFDKVS